ncbi:MAG TPA: helix-turn-helix domain-containing protein [Terriglobia bacterium]|nr:helix-turn-helix domain-containing protein [Terriglobia bacterium]
MSKSSHNPETSEASEVIRTPAARPAREARATRPIAPWPEWLDLHSLTEYAVVSERTVRGWIHAPTDPLPAVQVRGKILIKRSELDRWLEQHIVKSVDLGGIVEGIVEAMTHGR